MNTDLLDPFFAALRQAKPIIINNSFALDVAWSAFARCCSGFGLKASPSNNTMGSEVKKLGPGQGPKDLAKRFASGCIFVDVTRDDHQLTRLIEAHMNKHIVCKMSMDICFASSF